MLAAGARETLQRYAITFWLLAPTRRSTAVRWRKRAAPSRKSLRAARYQRAGVLRQGGVQSLVLTLRDEGYISDSGDAEPQKR